MLALLKNILDTMPSVSAWLINKEEKCTAELFLIQDKVDMNRACDSEEYVVKVFADFNEGDTKYKGDATCTIGASDSEAEIRQKLEKAALSASFVKNPWYDLPENDDSPVLKPVTFPTIAELKAQFANLHKIIYKAYPYQSKVNSCELFASQSYYHVLSSKGVDVNFERSAFSMELVTESEIGKEPVEIFKPYNLSRLDLQKVESIVDKQLMETEGRALATRNPKMENMRVILSGDAVEEFLYFYWEQANASSIYQKSSRAELGKAFQSESAKESLTMRINPALVNAINASPVDSEGKKLKAYTLFDKGVVKNIVGNAKFSHYLGVENLGNCNIFAVEAGKESLTSYMQGEYVEILGFSSFLMDSTTGDFGGEFRLAKHIKDGKVSYITGGSISETVFDVQDSMHFSSELEERNHSLAPKAIILDGITVAGE